MKVFGEITRRIGELLLLLLVLSIVVFALLYLAPGDPARLLVGTRQASPELLASIRAAYHLDEPLWRQYLLWLGGLLHGDLGTSIRTGLPVSSMIAPRAGVTIELAALAGVLTVAIGLPLGVLAARRHGRNSDHVINALAVTGVSAPSYAVGLLALYVFAVWLRWFPVYGVGDGSAADRLWHLALPALTLALGAVASVIKVTRVSMIRELNADYSSFARSRGIVERRITGSQLRNAAGPIVTSSGLVMASLIGGTVLVETTFAVGGLGSLLAESVTFKDIPVVQAITLAMAAAICTISAFADALVTAFDPRLRRTRRHRSAASVTSISSVAS